MSGGCDGVTKPGEIGYIQSCGYLVAFEEDAKCPSGMRILGASDNIVEVPWIHASCQAELLGKDLGQVFRVLQCVDTVCSLVKRSKEVRKPRTDHMAPKVNRNTADIYPAARTRAELELEAGNKNGVMTLTLAISNPGVYLLEIESKHGPHGPRAERTPELLQVADLLACMPVGANPKLSTAALADALAECMPGYDRIMVYRFAKDDGSGEVLHESIQPGSEVESSYVGFHFPAADIPPNARELFKLVGARYISDTSAAGVPISCLNERVAVLDLSRSSLRACAECHLRYLRNMGVKASMSVAIVVDGDLWGLFIFHSYSRPVHPSPEERIMVDMAVTITASLISRHQREEIATTAFGLSLVLGNLHSYPVVQDFLSAEHKGLLRILDVDTIVLCEQSRSFNIYGNKDISLTLSECKDLVEGAEPSNRTVLFKPLGARGLAYFSVRSCLVAFLRGSVASHVKWGGKPDEKRLEREPMCPRSSFDLFIETAAASVKPWSPATVDLVKMVHQVFSSRLYAQSLPFDLHETFAQVSHELRTPFHGVMGALDILEAGVGGMGTEDQRDLLRSALRCGNSMMATLDGILDIAKDRNDTEAALGGFTVSSPVVVTKGAMGPFATTESVNLVSDTGSADNDVLEVVGDYRRLRGVLQNLVNNAIKFTPRGGTVRVSLVVLDSPQDVVDWWAKEAGRFDDSVWLGTPTASDLHAEEPSSRSSMKWYVYCVEDSGSGIPPLELPHLVMAYRQVSCSASRAHAGTGLGLHICKSYVDIMGGTLGIASTFSEADKRGGTLFAVAVGLHLLEVDEAVEVDAEDGNNNDAGEVGLLPRVRDIGSRKIAFLVVDDQKVNIKLMEHKIRQHFKSSSGDVQVFTATDAFVALDVHEAQRSAEQGGSVLAGIFVDFHMPDFDGFECTRRIRLLEASRGWPQITVCGCTADMTDESRDTFSDAGGDFVVCKPWRPGQVEGVCNAMVAKVLGPDQSSAGA